MGDHHGHLLDHPGLAGAADVGGYRPVFEDRRADDHGGYRGNRCGGVQVGQVALVSDLEADVLDGSEALADSGADGDGGSVQVVVGVCASLHELLEQPAVPANQREQTVDEAFGEVLNRGFGGKLAP